MTSLKDLNPDGSVRSETTYVYDAAGNVVQENGGDPAADTLTTSRAEKAGTEEVVYEANGPGLSPAPGSVEAAANVTAVTEDVNGLYGDLQMTYTADNRLATVNGEAVTYDAEGNMISGPLNGSTQTYRYDARNRLIEAGGVTYGYDNENNRNSITANGVTTKQIVNPHAVLSQVLMETDAAGTPQARYVYGLGLIGREDAAGNYQTYHYDMRGSTTALTSEQGQVTDTYTYDTYGERLSHEGTSTQPFQYNGRGRRADGHERFVPDASALLQPGDQALREPGRLER